MAHGRKKDNQPHTDYLHIFKLQEDENILSITHEQEQPTYKLEYHYTNYEKIKMHYLRKSTSFVKMTWTLLLCDAFTRRILKEVTMMNTIKSTIHTEAIFSDDEQHRYLLKKTWDEKKAACTVITMYPHLDGVLSLDLTTVLILNQLANSERYGAVYLVNLFSNIRTPENLKHIKNPYDEHTDIHLMKAISESDTVILAYGAYAKRPVVIDRVEQVMEMLKPHKKKVKSSSIQ